MAMSDEEIFQESLKMWDRADRVGRDGPPVIKLDDNVEQMIDDMFDRFCNLDLDYDSPFIGNC
jgi:hypothetical protein